MEYNLIYEIELSGNSAITDHLRAGDTCLNIGKLIEEDNRENKWEVSLVFPADNDNAAKEYAKNLVSMRCRFHKMLKYKIVKEGEIV